MLSIHRPDSKEREEIALEEEEWKKDNLSDEQIETKRTDRFYRNTFITIRYRTKTKLEHDNKKATQLSRSQVLLSGMSSSRAKLVTDAYNETKF